MTLREKAKAKSAIRTIARREHKPTKEIRQAIQDALDAAWSAAWAPGNLSAQIQWQRLFPGPRKPTAEELIIKISQLQPEFPCPTIQS